MRRPAFIFVVVWGTFSPFVKGSENAEVLARRSAIQRQKEEILKIDLQITRVTATWDRISNDFQDQANLLQSNLASIEKLASSQNAEMENLSKWMNEKYQVVINASSSNIFRSVMEEYRALRMGNGCKTSSLDETIMAAIGNLNGLRNLSREALDLDKNWDMPTEFDSLRKSIKDNSEVMTANFEAAKKAVISVMPLAVSSDVCDAFLQFDVVVSLSQTIAEVNKEVSSIDAIDLNKFLKDLDNVNKERNLIKSSRRIATSMSGRNVTNIRLGKLNETLQLSATYQNQIESILAPLGSLRYVAEGERNEVISTLNSAVESVAKELEASKVFTLEGKRTFLLTRSQNVHTRLFKLNSLTLDPLKADLFQKAKSYCQTELAMTPAIRYRLPSNLDFEQSIKLDEKFAKAQEMLAKIDGVEI